MEKAYLIGIDFKADLFEIQYQFDELTNLANSLDIEIVGSISQKRDFPDNKYYLGKGKLEEIKAIVAEIKVETLIFNDSLSSSQIKNLEEFFEMKIVDRSYLILEIFEKRAQTKESIYEVELAKLKYILPRLIGLNNSLDRQTSSGGEFRSKGSGEKKLELDRRTIKNKIVVLEKKLKEIKSQRTVNREQRQKNSFPIVSLVGYTNAGKSATMNNFLRASQANFEVLEKDLLFSTLSTTAKKIKLKSFMDFILIDTVGFLSKLPHELINSFKSTLEEIKYSDLILHVVDISNPNYEEQIKITNEVLQEIGIENKNTIYVFNKLDLMKDNFISSMNDYVLISNKTSKNFNFLMDKVKEELSKNLMEFEITVDYTNPKLIHYVESNCTILKKEILENSIQYMLKLSEESKNFIVNLLRK